jgi:carboxymethylenebutenolidase
MTQQTHDQYDPEQQEGDLSRRDFVAMGLAAGVVAAGIPASAAMPVVETMVEIKTPDGTCDAAFSHPTTGSYPAVIIWADAFGLRPALRDMGKRLAGEGYAVLAPNPYYRVGKGTLLDTKTFSFQNDRAKLTPLMGSIQADGAAEKDAAAFVAWLDTQKQVNASKKIGTQGYCMGGPLVMRTSAALPNRIGAGASFHGGGLVARDASGADRPNSPHLLIPKIKGKMYFGIASNDDKGQPDAKDTLKAAFAAANNPAKIEVYANALHGWCMSDMPVAAGAAPIYNQADAERAWSELLALYKAALA